MGGLPTRSLVVSDGSSDGSSPIASRFAICSGMGSLPAATVSEFY
jgi:hypothetical protein